MAVKIETLEIFRTTYFLFHFCRIYAVIKRIKEFQFLCDTCSIYFKHQHLGPMAFRDFTTREIKGDWNVALYDIATQPKHHIICNNLIMLKRQSNLHWIVDFFITSYAIVYAIVGGDLVAVYCLTEYIGMLYQYTAIYCLVTDFFLFLLSHCCGQSNKVVQHSIVHSWAAPTNEARASPPRNGPLVNMNNLENAVSCLHLWALLKRNYFINNLEDLMITKNVFLS
ncbi:hypothetical protein ACJX0J_019923 [Zea mays]